jgi:SAM-dependent methyltransferase
VSTELQREFFERLAHRYDDRFLRARWPRNQEVKARHIADLLGPAMDAGPLVEVGCGTGQIAELLLAGHPRLRYVGLDLSEAMLEIARARLGRFADRAELRVVGGVDLALQPDTYAAAFGVDVLHHVDDPSALLSSLRRSLRPRAKAVFLEGNRRFPIAAAMGLLQREERGLLRIGFRNLRAWFASAGFGDVRVDYGPLYTPPGPPRLSALLDRADRIAARTPVLRALAIFLSAQGRVPER